MFSAKHPQTKKTGDAGEGLAEKYLKDMGWKILGRNIKRGFGEVDILAIDKDKALVFVEVKTLRGGGVGWMKPEDNFSSAKMQKTRRIAQFMANEMEDSIDPRVGWRIDLIALTINNKDCLINHYRNV